MTTEENNNLYEKKEDRNINDDVVINEKYIASVLVSFLKKLGWEVYQEVVVRDRILDILCVKKGKYWAIECKMRPSFALIEQAYNWKKYAEYVSICVFFPKSKRSIKNLGIIKKILYNFGIGFLAVMDDNRCVEFIQPVLNENLMYKNRIKLYEEQKDLYGAGSRGGYYSPFKKTCQELRQVVSNNPGISLREAVSKINHHYLNNDSAIKSLMKLIARNVVDGIVMHKKNGVRRLYLKESLNNINDNS